MIADKLPDDLIAFLQSGCRLDFDAADCEIGVFSLRFLNDIEEIAMTVAAEKGDSSCVIRGLDLLKSCEDYNPRGMLVYIPSLRKYGSYDAEKKSLITFRDMSWSAFRADPAKYINAGWSGDDKIAEETFTERDADRIVDVYSAADPAQARAVCSVFSAKGIRADVFGTSLGATPRLLTREGDAGRAREIIADWIRRRSAAESAATADVVFRCHGCGISLSFPASSRGFVETCPACGVDVDVPDDRGNTPLAESAVAEVILLDDEPAGTASSEPTAAEKAAPAEASPLDDDGESA